MMNAMDETERTADEIAAHALSADEPWTIDVVCEQDRRTAQIASFRELPDGRWYHRPHRKFRAVDGEKDETRRPSKSATVATPLAGEVPTKPVPGVDVRFTYDLACPLCKRSVRVRGDRLYPFLTDRRHAGVTRLTLPDLGAIFE